jgi:hypothetical protein
MSFTTTMFDELILELGELATLRDEALRHPEIAASPALFGPVNALVVDARSEAERRATMLGSPASTIRERIRFREPPPWTG